MRPVTLRSGRNTLRGDVVLPLSEGPFPAVCKLHGLPGSPDQVVGIATELARAGFAVLTFDFRGFRRSRGTFSLAGQLEDTQTAIRFLLAQPYVRGGKVALYGASFGGAIAICAAARTPAVGAVCVRAPVYDTEQFAHSPAAYEVLEYVQREMPSEMHGLETADDVEEVVRHLREDARTYNPIRDVALVTPRPLLIVTGDRDELIDLAGVRRLHDRAGQPKSLIVVEGADHVLSDPMARRRTTEIVIRWMRDNHPAA